MNLKNVRLMIYIGEANMKIIRNNNELISLFPEYYNNLDIKNLKISKYIEIQYVNDNSIVLYSFISDSIGCLSLLDSFSI